MTLDASDDGLSGGTVAASGFVGSLGVDTHLPYTDGGYANIANVLADLDYLGLSNVRDGITNGEFGSAPISTYISLAQDGVKFTFAVATGGAVTTASLDAKLSLIDQVNEAAPGSVVAVEGANEINNFPITFNGETDDLTAAIDLQQALYTDVHSDPNLPGVGVDYFTGYNAYSIPDEQPIGQGPDPAHTDGLADFDNQHPYPADSTAPGTTIIPNYALQNERSYTGFGPAVYTETGYSTDVGTTGAVNQDVQAKYTLDLLFDSAVDSISRTYLFQLLDAYQPGSPQGDDGFGLFDPSNTPKEAATAIHDVTTILADPGAPANFTPTPLAYSVTDLPNTGNSIALEKSTGAYDVVVYNEPQIWDAQTETETAVPTQTVTVELGSTFGTVELFDPLVSALPQEILHDVSSVQLGLTDHPLIVETEPPCYCPGTMILTDRGEVAVEALAIGDLVCTVAAGMQPIRWIGRRSYNGRFLSGQLLMLPVCIKAGALDASIPSRDLYVSPGHALYLDGVLIPAWRLVNGVSITQAEAVDHVSYLHVELAEHEIILANGCAAESFFDDAGCRNQFQNIGEFDALFRAAAGETRTMCAPRVEEGFQLQAIQRRLAARAGATTKSCPPGALRGYVDHAGPEMVSGWAQDMANPEEPVCLDIVLDGRRIARVVANRFRADLRAAGLGSGTHAFELRACPGAGFVAVRRSLDGMPLALTDDARLIIAA